MPAWLKHLSTGIRVCAGAAATLFFWVLWLALAGALVVQVGIGLSRELEVPGFVLRSFEEQFTAANIQARFDRATFDPTGGVLIEHVRLSLPEYAEPVVDIRAIYLELNPWLLFVGRFEARRIHATGVKLFVPAMLSPTGRSEELLSDLDVVVSPTHTQLTVEHLTARIAGIALTAQGGLQLEPERIAGRGAPLPFLATLARHYPNFSRQLIRAAEYVAPFEEPAIHLALTPSLSRGAIANVSLATSRVNLPEFRNLTASEVVLSIRVPLLGDASSLSPVNFTAAEVRIDGGMVARDVSARARGLFKRTPFSYAPREIEASAREIAAHGFTLNGVSAQIEPQAWPQVTGNLLARDAESVVALNGHIDVTRKTAEVQLDGTLSPALLEPIGAVIGRDIRPFIGFGAPVKLDLGATFTEGWKFARLAGRIAAQQIDAYRVPIDSVQGEIEFDGRHFIARHARARLGDNSARGSFEQDLVTRQFRFLLEGRLRPLAISGWFRPWWTNFFNELDFPITPPAASVDVAGRWRAGHETTVFVFAESDGAAIRGAKFDYARTLMFIRPSFIDGLELFGTRGAGDIRGTFTRSFDLDRRDWKEMTLDFVSTLELENGAKLLGPTLAARLEPLTFEQAPNAKVSGHFTGPAAPEGSHQTIYITGQSTGGFSIYRFPARNVSFQADIRDGELTLENVEAEVAGGTLTGRARIWGDDAERRLGFDAALRGASLSRAVATVNDYAAVRRGETPLSAERPLSVKSNVRLDLALSAEGRFDDLHSYQGSGNAALEGAELGEVRLLGLLSALLDFTALRFTSARAEFRVVGPSVIFPAVSVTGANAAIHAHGDYSLQRRELDFNARVYPFEESKSLLQSMVGAVLSPLSTMLEVKLTGRLEQPSWAFVMGPTNLLRSLSQPAQTTDKPAASSPPTAPTSAAPVSSGNSP